MNQFIADLKDSVMEAKTAPSGKGTMVAIYGMNTMIVFPLFLRNFRSREFECRGSRHGWPPCICISRLRL